MTQGQAAQGGTAKSLMGFRDPDLSTSEHDTLMAWLDDNIEAAIDQLLPFAHRRVPWGLPPPATLTDPLPPPHRNIDPHRWEVPIERGDRAGWIVGYVDMAVTVHRTHPYTEDDVTWSVRLEPETIFFEVKSRIESLGETIRQVRTYEHYAAGVHVIVSPDDRFRDRFEAQGIRFVKVPAVGARAPRQARLAF